MGPRIEPEKEVSHVLLGISSDSKSTRWTMLCSRRLRSSSSIDVIRAGLPKERASRKQRIAAILAGGLQKLAHPFNPAFPEGAAGAVEAYSMGTQPRSCVHVALEDSREFLRSQGSLAAHNLDLALEPIFLLRV